MTDVSQAQAILASPDYFLCEKYNCRMSHSACSMRKRVARQQDEDGKDVTFSKCLDCPVKEGPVEKVCMVEGCGKKITARGRCSTHYAQYRSEIQKKGKVPVVGEGAKPKTNLPVDPLPGKAISRVDYVAIAAQQKIPAEKKPNGTKRVNVTFTGPDMALWEKLKAQAKRNRRDLRTEALFIIEQAINGG